MRVFDDQTAMHLLVFRQMFSWYNKGQYSHARFGYIHWQNKVRSGQVRLHALPLSLHYDCFSFSASLSLWFMYRERKSKKWPIGQLRVSSTCKFSCIGETVFWGGFHKTGFNFRPFIWWFSLFALVLRSILYLLKYLFYLRRWKNSSSMTYSPHRFLGLVLLQSAPFFTPQSHYSYMVLWWWVLAVPNELIIRPGRKKLWFFSKSSAWTLYIGI